MTERQKEAQRQMDEQEDEQSNRQSKSLITSSEEIIYLIYMWFELHTSMFWQSAARQEKTC